MYKKLTWTISRKWKDFTGFNLRMIYIPWVRNIFCFKEDLQQFFQIFLQSLYIL